MEEQKQKTDSTPRISRAVGLVEIHPGILPQYIIGVWFIASANTGNVFVYKI